MMIGIVLVLAAVSQSGQESGPPPDYLASDFAAVVENAEAIQSGQFVATGSHVVESRNGGEFHTVEVSIEGAFDFNQHKIRFVRSNLPVDVPANSRLATARKTWQIFRPDQYIAGVQVGGDGKRSVVSLRSPIPVESAEEMYQPIFDIRSIAFARYRTLRHPLQWHLNDLSSASIQKGDEVPNRTHLFHTVIAEEKTWGERVDMWLDQAQGGQITKYTVTTFDDSRPNSDFLETTIDTTWIHLDGKDIWLPATIDSWQSGDRLKLAFSWKNVNEPIADELFTWQSFDLPTNTEVVDTSIVDKVPVHVRWLDGTLRSQCKKQW